MTYAITKGCNGAGESSGFALVALSRPPAEPNRSSMKMKVIPRNFSLRLLLIAITVFCLVLGLSRHFYAVDQKRVRQLGPVIYTGKTGKGHGWSMSPHVYAAYKWVAPEVLESPMRQLGIPWFDRFTEIVIVHDKHVTTETATALANSKYLMKIEIRTRDARHTRYKQLEASSAGRIAIDYILVDHD